MTLTEIKKELYKQKPIASFMYAANNCLYYQAELIEGERPINFCVPMNDMGDARFEQQMESQLLIRYIVAA